MHFTRYYKIYKTGCKSVKNNNNLSWTKYFAIGIELAFSVIAGLVVGDFVDGKLNTQTPWFSLLGLIIGLIAGVNILIRLLKKNDDSHNESE